MKQLSILLLMMCVLCAGNRTVFSAGLSEWGATSQTSTKNCPSFCTDVEFGPLTGGKNQSSAFSSISDSRGNAQNSASLDPSPGLSVPLLKAEAYSAGGLGGAQSIAFAVEGYTYTGSSSANVMISSTLTGDVFDPADDLSNRVLAQVYLFEEQDFEFIRSLGTLISEVGAIVIDSYEMSIQQTETGAVRNGSMNVVLNPGQSVYLWTYLQADGQRDGSFADAFSTLVNTINDPTDGLVAASQVPEPSSLGLPLMAMLSLTGCRRCRNRIWVHIGVSLRQSRLHR
jgi:hypothetical protein